MFILLSLFLSQIFSQVLRPCIPPTPLAIDFDHTGHDHPTAAPTPMPPCLSTTDTGTIMVETSSTMTPLETTLTTTSTLSTTTLMSTTSTLPTKTTLMTTTPVPVATVNSGSSWNLNKMLVMLAIAIKVS